MHSKFFKAEFYDILGANRSMESKIWCKHTLNLNDIFLKMLCISGIKYLHLTF